MFTLAVDGPFQIDTLPYVIKGNARQPVVCGDLITPVKATAIAGSETLDLTRVIDGANLSHRDTDPLWECATDAKTMWSSTGHDPVTAIEFDLGGAHRLNCIQIWNYNLPNRTHQGLGRTNVSVWTAENDWQTVLEDATLMQAEGTIDYDIPTVLSLDNVTAAKVRFDHLQGFESSGPIGLSAVRFYTERTNQVSKPYPEPGQKVLLTNDLNLSWTSGLHTPQQKVYLGTNAQNLSFVEELDQDGFCQVALQGVQPDTDYYWRVDSIGADGTVTTGELWHFRTTALMAHWTFDETAGTLVRDVTGHGHHAKVVGDPQWRPEHGQYNGALYLEGERTHVVLPEAIGNGPAGKTFVMWAHPTEVRRWARFLEIGNGQTDDNVLFARFNDSESLVVSTYREYSSGTRVIAEDVLDPNTWQFVAMSLDTNGDVKIYHNGKLAAEGNAGISIRDIVRHCNYIGRSSWPNDQYYCGMIDDTRMYSLILTPEQIQKIYQDRDASLASQDQALPTLTDMPIEPTDDTEPTTVSDDSSSPNNGVVVAIIVAIVAALILISNGSRRKKA